MDDSNAQCVYVEAQIAIDTGPKLPAWPDLSTPSLKKSFVESEGRQSIEVQGC